MMLRCRLEWWDGFSVLQLGVGSSSHPPYWLMSMYPRGSITQMCLRMLCWVREVMQMRLLGIKRKRGSHMQFQSHGECYGWKCPSGTVKTAGEILPQQGKWLYNRLSEGKLCAPEALLLHAVFQWLLFPALKVICSPDSPFPPGSLKSSAFPERCPGSLCEKGECSHWDTLSSCSVALP